MPRLRFLSIALFYAVGIGFAYSAPVPADADWVTIRGRIVWPEKADIPNNPPVNLGGVGQDKEYALRGGPIFEDKVLVAPKTRGLKNVVVSLRPDSVEKNVLFPVEKIHPTLKDAKPTTYVVKSEYCRYDRRILAARLGDRIEYRNDQQVFDNIKFDNSEQQSNRTQKPETSWTTDPLKGRIAVFESSIHYWMRGYVRIFDHPYFAITDEDGDFVIPKAPTGKWRIHYWHELGFHKGPEGRNGFPIDVKDEARGVKTIPTVEFEEVRQLP